MHTKIRHWLHTGSWVLFITGAVAGLCMQFYFYKFFGTDTLSYINIAELYAAGKFELATNGYWSPLYSWCIALFIKAGMAPVPVCYCMNMAAAAACFYFIKKTGDRYFKNPVIYVLFQLCIMGSLLFYAMSDLTPDLLGAAATLWFLTLLWPEGIHTAPSRPVWTGIAGAVAFMTKSYNFVFVNLLFLFLLALAIRAAVKEKDQRYRAIGFAYLIYWSISLAWLIPLSIHEKAPVFSTAGGYSHAYVHPAHPGHPITNGIIAPPFPEAYTAWLRPAHQLDAYAWDSFGSMQYMRYQLHLITHTIMEWYRILDPHYIKTVLLFACILLLAWYDKKRLAIVFSHIKPWMLVLLMYPLGYFPFFILERYVYIDVLIFYFLFFYLLQEALALFPGRRIPYYTMLAAVSVFVWMGIRRQGFIKQKTADYQYYRALHTVLPRLQFLQAARMVSDNHCYVVATQLCYRLQARLYGVWSYREQSKAQQYQVQYLLTDTPRQEGFLQLREVVPLLNRRLYVYAFINPLSHLPNREHSEFAGFLHRDPTDSAGTVE